MRRPTADQAARDGDGRPGRRDARRAAAEGIRPHPGRRAQRRWRSTTSEPSDGCILLGDARCCRSSWTVSAWQADVLARLTDSIETAYGEGGGAAFALEVRRPTGRAGRTSRVRERFECRACGIAYEDPQPRLFSFNNPFGACPTCHGFGNVIELDMDLVVPDPTKSIQENAIEPWSKPHYRACLAELKRAARARGVRLDVPWAELTPEEKRFVIDGDGERVRRHPRVLRLARAQEVQGPRPRVPQRGTAGTRRARTAAATRLRREARDVRVGGRTIDARVRADGPRGAPVLRHPHARRARRGDRRQGAARRSAAGSDS